MGNGTSSNPKIMGIISKFITELYEHCNFDVGIVETILKLRTCSEGRNGTNQLNQIKYKYNKK